MGSPSQPVVGQPWRGQATPAATGTVPATLRSWDGSPRHAGGQITVQLNLLTVVLFWLVPLKGPYLPISSYIVLEQRRLDRPLEASGAKTSVRPPSKGISTHVKPFFRPILELADRYWYSCILPTSFLPPPCTQALAMGSASSPPSSSSPSSQSPAASSAGVGNVSKVELQVFVVVNSLRARGNKMAKELASL